MRSFILTILVMGAWGLSVFPPPASAEGQTKRYYDRQPGSERRPEDKPRPKGEIDFEQFRMLGTGMTQAEVTARVGGPKQVFRFGHNIEHWVYSTEDQWIIELTFTSGRVANIDRYRPRP